MQKKPHQKSPSATTAALPLKAKAKLRESRPVMAWEQIQRTSCFNRLPFGQARGATASGGGQGEGRRATALVSDMQRKLSAAKQRLVLVKNGIELSGLQFAVSNLEKLPRQSEQNRVGLLQVTARGGGQLGDASTHTTLFQHLPLPDAERHPHASRRC